MTSRDNPDRPARAETGEAERLGIPLGRRESELPFESRERARAVAVQPEEQRSPDEPPRQSDRAEYDPHTWELGFDPAVGHFRPNEAAAGLLVESARGVALTRYPSADLDWKDAAEKTYDAVGRFSVEHFDGEWENIQRRILGHTKKADFVPIDVTNLHETQIARIDKFIQDRDLMQQVFVVGR